MAMCLTHLGRHRLGSALELDKPLGIVLHQSNLSLAKCRLETTSRRRSIVSHDGISRKRGRAAAVLNGAAERNDARPQHWKVFFAT